MKDIIKKAQEITGVKDRNLVNLIELLIDEVKHLQEENKDLEHKLSNPEDYEPVGEWWE